MKTRLLCLDTSTTTARIAILDGEGAPLAAREVTAERHSAHVLRLCDEALRAAGLGLGDLTGIACGGGPGSFTGLRVALAVAKGLAMPAGLPLLLVPSLDALALDMLAAIGSGATADAPPVVPCIDAGKGEIYAGVYHADPTTLVRADAAEAWRVSPAALALSLAEIAGALVAGNGADRHAVALDAAGLQRIRVAGPTALSLGRLALLRHRRGESDDLDRAVPLYGRPPDITVKKPFPGAPR